MSFCVQGHHGTDMLDGTSEKQDQVVEKQTTSGEELSTATKPGPSYGDEKIKVDDTLAFSYDYTCTNSGYETTSFEVKAEYDSISTRLTFIGTKNIDSFGSPNVRFTGHTASWREFEGGFKYSFCRTYAEVICTYNFYGHLAGELYTHFMYVSITEAHNDNAYNPAIYENCVDLRAGPVCLAAYGSRCTFHRVRSSHPQGVSSEKSIET